MMKKTLLKRSLALLIVAVMTLGLAACGNPSANTAPSSTPGNSSDSNGTPAPGNQTPAPDDGKTYEIIVNMIQAAESPQVKAVNEACAAMEEASNGRLKFTVHDSGTLLAAPDTFKGVQDGLCDITFMPTSFSFDYTPLNSRLLVLPFIGYPDGQTAFDVYNTLREEYPRIDEEFEDYGIINLGAWFGSSVQLYMAKSDVSFSSVEDMKGMKIGVSDKYLTDFLNAVGATPVFVTNADMYTSLDNNVVDGILQHGPLMQITGCLDIIKTVVNFGDQGLMRSTSAMVMNKAKYDSLPEDLQTILKDGFAEFCVTGQKLDIGQATNVKKILTDNGCTFIDLSEEQVASFAAQAEDIQDNCISEIEAMNIPAQEIYDRTQELIAG